MLYEVELVNQVVHKISMVNVRTPMKSGKTVGPDDFPVWCLMSGEFLRTRETCRGIKLKEKRSGS